MSESWSKDRYINGNGNHMDTPSISIEPGKYIPRNYLREVQFTNIPRKYLRVLFKNGSFNVDQKKANLRFDFILSLVEARWRWTLINFSIALTALWFLFAIIYWIISLTHGDIANIDDVKFPNMTQNHPCIRNIYGFTSALLFSIRAYGKRALTLECPATVLTWCFQWIVSTIFQAIMIGILFAKLSRPRARTQTILFSKNAVVNIRNDKFCLIFRVGDMRKSKIINIKPSAYIIMYKTDSIYMDNDEQIELKVDIDECESTFFLWPVTVVHIIDETSPFYGLSAADLLNSHLEVLVVFEGTIESTGQPVQARTSYTEYEILWGHRFIPMVEYKKNKNVYDVDYSRLSDVKKVLTPLCSASEYDHIVQEFDSELL